MDEQALERSWKVMRWTYALVPIAAGADKFTNLLADWQKYMSPLAKRVTPMAPRRFMRVVGLIEIAAGVLVLDRRTTRLGAYVVGGWLGAIALNLIANRDYDIAVRDIVLGIGAITFARLTKARVAEQRSEARTIEPEAEAGRGVPMEPGPANERRIESAPRL